MTPRLQWGSSNSRENLWTAWGEYAPLVSCFEPMFQKTLPTHSAPNAFRNSHAFLMLRSPCPHTPPFHMPFTEPRMPSPPLPGELLTLKDSGQTALVLPIHAKCFFLFTSLFCTWMLSDEGQRPGLTYLWGRSGSELTCCVPYMLN